MISGHKSDHAASFPALYLTDKLAHPVRQGFGFLCWKVNPDGGGASGRANHARLVRAFHRDPAFKSGATGITHIHPDQHVTWIFKLLVKVAKRIDDNRAFALWIGLAANGVHPVNPGSFHVAKVGAIVQVSHRVHVTPSNGDVHFVHQVFLLGNLDFHDSVILSGAGDGPL